LYCKKNNYLCVQKIIFTEPEVFKKTGNYHNSPKCETGRLTAHTGMAWALLVFGNFTSAVVGRLSYALYPQMLRVFFQIVENAQRYE
jgi:hypothetical protein